jgi:uracil-DNA glycosylase
MAGVERGFANEWAAELAGTLNWWTEAGVDCLVQDEPRGWLKDASQPSARPEHSRGATAPTAELRPSTSLGTSAGGDLPDQLPLFHEWLRTSDALPYAAPAAPRICPSGDPAAGLMILAGMPSTEDCASGTLISGAAGKLFDRMLAAIGRNRETIYLAGLSCLRPVSGRFDAAGASRCAEIARHHLALAGPKAVLLLGDGAARPLLGLGAAQARGRVHRIETARGSFDAVVTLSPDYLLAQPSAKALAWADLQLLMELLK